MSEEKSKSERPRFCRGCGKPLLEEGRRQFHPECLRADKRWRMSEQRKRLWEQFKKWLAHQVCPHCGSQWGAGAAGAARANERNGETFAAQHDVTTVTELRLQHGGSHESG